MRSSSPWGPRQLSPLPCDMFSRRVFDLTGGLGPALGTPLARRSRFPGEQLAIAAHVGQPVPQLSHLSSNVVVLRCGSSRGRAHVPLVLVGQGLQLAACPVCNATLPRHTPVPALGATPRSCGYRPTLSVRGALPIRQPVGSRLRRLPHLFRFTDHLWSLSTIAVSRALLRRRSVEVSTAERAFDLAVHRPVGMTLRAQDHEVLPPATGHTQRLRDAALLRVLKAHTGATVVTRRHGLSVSPVLRVIHALHRPPPCSCLGRTEVRPAQSRNR